MTSPVIVIGVPPLTVNEVPAGTHCGWYPARLDDEFVTVIAPADVIANVVLPVELLIGIDRNTDFSGSATPFVSKAVEEAESTKATPSG